MSPSMRRRGMLLTDFEKVRMMDTLFARYFDGELNEREAREFLDAVEANSKLEKELRAYEQVLTMGKKLTGPRAPEGFTQRVMAEVKMGGEPERRSVIPVWFTMRWAPAAVAAAESRPSPRPPSTLR